MKVEHTIVYAHVFRSLATLQTFPANNLSSQSVYERTAAGTARVYLGELCVLASLSK